MAWVHWWYFVGSHSASWSVSKFIYKAQTYRFCSRDRVARLSGMEAWHAFNLPCSPILSANETQRQGHTPPPGAVSSCYPRRLLPIGTLSFQHCHSFWLTETQSWATAYRTFFDVYPLPPSHIRLLLSKVCRRRWWKFYFPKKSTHLLASYHWSHYNE